VIKISFLCKSFQPDSKSDLDYVFTPKG